MSAAVDPIKGVRALLLADTDVAALVGDSVYGAEIPETLSASMPVAAIVLKPAGGPSRPGGGYQQFGAVRVDVVCYGETLKQSWSVYLAVYTALQDLRRGVYDGVLLHSADPSSKGVTARDPVTQWPTTYSSWLVLASEVAAA